jgi:hypothetical protein
MRRLGNYQKADEDLLHSLIINPDDAYVLELFGVFMVRERL